MRRFFLKHLRSWKFHSSMLFWLKARANPKRKISSVLVKLERCCGEPIFQTRSIVFNGFVHPPNSPSPVAPDRWMTSVFPSFWHEWHLREIIYTRRRESDFKFVFLRFLIAFRSRGAAWVKMPELGERGIFPDGRSAAKIYAVARRTRSPLDIAVKNITFTQVGQFRHGRAPV